METMESQPHDELRSAHCHQDRENLQIMHNNNSDPRYRSTTLRALLCACRV